MLVDLASSITETWDLVIKAITMDEKLTILWKNEQFFSIDLSFDEVHVIIELTSAEVYKSWIQQGTVEVNETLHTMLHNLKYCEILFDPCVRSPFRLASLLYFL